MSRTPRNLALALLLLVLALPSAASASTSCTDGGKQRAAKALYGAGAELVAVERVAGMRTALVLEPRIAPGTRRRMVAVDGGWCDATSGFNQAWTGASGAKMAAAYARLAAAPYFDGVTVRDVQSAGAVHTITTHARTNGVVARWVIVTDAEGVRAATWTATAFAEKPFVAQIEGLTALPDATESYDRVAGGVLRPRTGLPTSRSAASDGPGIGVKYTGSDGFPIEISYSEARGATPQLGQDLGVWDVDIIRITHRAVAENYEEFLRWGFERGWTPDTGGTVYINDALSAYCLACVLIADDFNIHMSSKALDALEALGYSYPGTPPERAWSNVIGHEMFHNFQNRYTKPGPVTELLTRHTTGTYYSEGTARLQESFHSYSEMSHQPESLIYASDANGCNGFDGGGTIHVQGVTQAPDYDREMARGVFTSSRSYATCFFWMPWFAANGTASFFDLVKRTMPAAKAETGAFEEGMKAVTGASRGDVLEQLQLFARSALTGGRGNTWGAIVGGPTFDWSEHLEAWTPKPLVSGAKHTRTLAAGGMMANAITETTRVTLTAPKEVRLFVVRDDGTSTSIRNARSDQRIGGPQPGEKVWVVAARPASGSSPVTLTAG